MIKKIAKFIIAKNNYIIIPHRNPDGDCLGSAIALAYGLRSMGKTAYVTLPNEPSDRLSFLWDDSLKAPEEFSCQVCISVDVASPYMMAQLEDEIFNKAPHTVCIDHHGTNTCFAQHNLVDSDAAACGEVIFRLLEHMGVDIDTRTATAIYVAIASDTGSFRYSNTTGETHRITAELIDMGIDAAGIMKRLFETRKPGELGAMAGIVSNMEYHFDGKVCLTYVDKSLLDEYGVTFDGVDEYVSLPRSIEGVEVGIFLKCYGPGETKVSLRSGEYVNVADIAASLGGGGHIRAAGVTIFDNLANTKKIILDKLKTLL